MYVGSGGAHSGLKLRVLTSSKRQWSIPKQFNTTILEPKPMVVALQSPGLRETKGTSLFPWKRQ